MQERVRVEQSGIVLPMVVSSGELALVPAPDLFATSSPCLHPPFTSLLAISTRSLHLLLSLLAHDTVSLIIF